MEKFSEFNFEAVKNHDLVLMSKEKLDQKWKNMFK
jgi:hypothetical protein